jgi:hypothetical protein
VSSITLVPIDHSRSEARALTTLVGNGLAHAPERFVHAPSAAKPRGSSGRGRRFTAETDSPLEESGFEPAPAGSLVRTGHPLAAERCCSPELLRTRLSG